MSERITEGPATSRAAVMPGPTLSFAFNLAKVPDKGEDSDPIVRDGPDLGLIAVFDGMGGAGGTVYDTAEGPRTGAYLASRVARDVVERRMVELLEPDWNLNGQAAAADLQRSIRAALQERLAQLNAPASGLRSRLLRALPTTMALLALQRTQLGGSTWACHVLWAGDSRAYVFEADGMRQLSTDDLRDPGDAMANLSRDSVVSNALSADTDFQVNYRRVELQAPFLVMCATDGCFGYVRTPMHFEHLVLDQLRRARNTQAWSTSLQTEIARVTGDDAAMSAMAVGADFASLKASLVPRVAQLERQFIAPLDDLSTAVSRAEQELASLRRRQHDKTAEVWGEYKSGYEHYLHAPDLADPEDGDVDLDIEDEGHQGMPESTAEIDGGDPATHDDATPVDRNAEASS